MAEEKQGVVFISCGQFTVPEKALGKALAKIVTDSTDFEGYFAESQSSLEGLSHNILGALNRCCGFVAVMHDRGQVQTSDGTHIRGSVWVEQELAIAAFLQQAQGRNIAVALYTQRGIKREGVREQLPLGPGDFDTEDEVLADFERRIADGRFAPVRLPPPKEVELRFGYKLLSHGGGKLHKYRLDLYVNNTGEERLTEYWLELQFPKAVFDSSDGLRVDQSPTYWVIQETRERLGVDLYPDRPLPVISVHYHMDDDLEDDGSVLNQPVVAVFGSTGMPRVRVEKPFRELQDF